MCVGVGIQCSRLPVGFAEVLEVVHVAASGWVLGVLRLPLLGIVDLQQVAVVLHHVLTLLERSRGKHRSPFSLNMLDLRQRVEQGGEIRQGKRPDSLLNTRGGNR